MMSLKLQKWNKYHFKQDRNFVISNLNIYNFSKKSKFSYSWLNLYRVETNYKYWKFGWNDKKYSKLVIRVCDTCCTRTWFLAYIWKVSTNNLIESYIIGEMSFSRLWNWHMSQLRGITSRFLRLESQEILVISWQPRKMSKKGTLEFLWHLQDCMTRT